MRFPVVAKSSNNFGPFSMKVGTDVFYTTVAQAIQEVKVTDIALTSHG
jgi:hypothetical protein